VDAVHPASGPTPSEGPPTHASVALPSHPSRIWKLESGATQQPDDATPSGGHPKSARGTPISLATSSKEAPLDTSYQLGWLEPVPVPSLRVRLLVSPNVTVIGARPPVVLPLVEVVDDPLLAVDVPDDPTLVAVPVSPPLPEDMPVSVA
jgi:hypothetical protein